MAPLFLYLKKTLEAPLSSHQTQYDVRVLPAPYTFMGLFPKVMQSNFFHAHYGHSKACLISLTRILKSLNQLLLLRFKKEIVSPLSRRLANIFGTEYEI